MASEGQRVAPGQKTHNHAQPPILQLGIALDACTDGFFDHTGSYRQLRPLPGKCVVLSEENSRLGKRTFRGPFKVMGVCLMQ